MTVQFPRAGRWLSRYVHLLVQLHKLTARNLDETDAADAVRDEMDLPWKRMTPEELRMVRELSADLYSITDPAPATVESFPRELDSLVSRALKDEDWVRVLQIVRENINRIPLHAASFLRGLAWSQLGLHEAAAEFFLHAVKLRPLQREYRAYMLPCLVYSGREREALPYAEQWAADDSDPSLLFTASNVLFLNADLSSADEARRLHRRAIEIAERALNGAYSAQLQTELQQKIINAFLHIALSYAYLGDPSKAQAAWERAAQLDPNNVDTLLVRSLLAQPQDELSSAARRNIARSLTGVPQEQSSELLSPAFPTDNSLPVSRILAN
jgi:tetratricopeptide (TPR) repeat protein